MIELTLVSGFLGSGKTTFLRNISEREGKRPIAFVVNEFADEDVDGKALADADARVMTVLGGSIFCECRAADFVEVLFLLASRNPDLEGVVVEASGMANPKSIGTLLRTSGLGRLYRVARVVSVVDPGHARVLLKTLPVFREQLEASHLILLNKCDCYSEEEIVAAEAAVRVAAPGVPHIRTTYSVMPEAEYHGDDALLDAPLVPCAPPEFCTVILHGSCLITEHALRVLLEQFSDQLYRVKGTVRCTDGDARIDYDGARWRHRVVSAGTGAGLVLIVDREKGHILEGTLRAQFAEAAANEAIGVKSKELLT